MLPPEKPNPIRTDKRRKIARRTMKHLDVLKRERKALEMRLGGFDTEEIGATVGLSRSAVNRAIDRAMARITKPAATELRDMAIGRLDAMLKAIWLEVLNGNLAAIDRALRLEERRAKMEGTDAPLKLDIAGMVAQVAAEFGLNDDESASLFADIQRELTAARLAEGAS